MRAWLSSPSPAPSDRKGFSSPTPSDNKDFKKPYPALRSWYSNSTFVNSAHGGPYELAGAAEEKDRKPYELYGSGPSSPTSSNRGLTSPNKANKILGFPHKSASADPLRSNPAPPPAAHDSNFWSPPSSYGSQPAELPLDSPRRTMRAAHRHRRTISERWGTSRYPAELEGGVV